MRRACDRHSQGEARWGTRCDARPHRLVSTSQHEYILARSHEGVLQYRHTVVITLLQKRCSVVADKREGVLRKDSRGRRDIVTQ
jgi:hypothetical protein